ncbi:hypothetical protein [Arenibacter certesii]|uniref:Uncharacterized protein n=1 Tax=Arenibacter certesii TaxID=228955 RepID=A0A918ITT9_9FLAO|nr:hypothetical protein [Arenibacter certesii]GGW30200.1 hypothetical protein GCM10007383_14350 [Arenibacter certesii]
MRPYIRFVLGGVTLLATLTSFIAQAQVRIEIPASNIINGSEFSTTRTVMNTGNYDSWRSQQTNPTIWSVSNMFTHKTIAGSNLPSSILHWQLDNIGGNRPKYHQHDVLPDFQWFSTSSKIWYEIHNPNASSFTAGNVVFKFKIPAAAFATNIFVPGEYKLTINHNYGGYFTPSSFDVIIVIPSTSASSINWVSNNTIVNHTISNLNIYREITGGQIPIGQTKISNTVKFNLWGKTTSAIQFISSKAVQSTVSPVFVKLESSNSSKISKLPLSQENWTNYTPNGPFAVVPGNQNTFDLNFSISNLDLKNHFFEAGTYTFQLELDAKSPDNAHSAKQLTDVTLVVPALSELIIAPSKQEVNFQFNSATHYQQGQSKVISTQIKLSNNENYELYVKSAASFFNKGGVQSNINSTILEVGVDGISTVALSTTPQKIISAGAPVLDQEFDIKYLISPSAAQSLIEKEKTTYSINVIYSFTAL